MDSPIHSKDDKTLDNFIDVKYTKTSNSLSAYFPPVCFNFYSFISAYCIGSPHVCCQNFRVGQFLQHTCGRLHSNNKMNIKIETDQKILYNGINLAWSRAMLFFVFL